jgi:hypothetical protein
MGCGLSADFGFVLAATGHVGTERCSDKYISIMGVEVGVCYLLVTAGGGVVQ